MTTKPVRKAARMLLLYRLREHITDLTLQKIGDHLNVNRSTILRDLRELEQIEREYRRLAATLPWKTTATVPEFAEMIGADPETIRCMLRDGLLKGHKERKRGKGGRWVIPLEEVEQFKRR